MKLSARTISELAEIICGASGNSDSYNWKNFPYRSSSGLTRFFRNCDLEFVHDSSTRNTWVETVLNELNQDQTSVPQLPSDSLIRVLQQLMEPSDYLKNQCDRNLAIVDLNKILSRDNIEAYFDATGQCHVQSIRSQVTSALVVTQPRPLSTKEVSRRQILERFLDSASEDEIIDNYLTPMFRQLGFLRVIPTGHRERSLEYGKDIWMKYRLPTGHFIYFAAQVKKDKIDASGKNLTTNISGILAQARMALESPIFDSENNRKHLIDHVFIISANLITKQARLLMGEHLDKEARRHIIFMDRDELLDLGAVTSIEMFTNKNGEEDIPF